MWKKAFQKAMKGKGKPLLSKSEEDKELERQEKAVEFLERKILSKACGRALSEGVGDLMHPEQRAQLEKKLHQEPSPYRASWSGTLLVFLFGP